MNSVHCACRKRKSLGFNKGELSSQTEVSFWRKNEFDSAHKTDDSLQVENTKIKSQVSTETSVAGQGIQL